MVLASHGRSTPVAAGKPLVEYIAGAYTQLTASEKRRLAVELGRTVRRWHDAGDYVADLAAIEIVDEAAGPRLVLGRMYPLHRGRLQSISRKRLRALGGLLADCWDITSRCQREYFLRSYALSDGIFTPGQRRVIEKHAYDKRMIQWRRDTKGCFKQNETFCAGRQMGFRFYGDKLRAGMALKALLPDPDAVLNKGKIYKPGSRTHAGRIEICGEYSFLKRFNYRGWWYRIRHIFHRSRAVHNWMVMWSFRTRQIPIAAPILCLEERFCRLLRRSYVLTDFVHSADRLRIVWPDLTEVERRSLLVRLAQILGRMHRFGCLHGDLKWDNILVHYDDEGWQVTLVDLDGSRILQKPVKKRAYKDIQRFLKDLDQADSSGYWTHFFYKSWYKWTAGL